jgi:transcriptional regulator with XRE-family HTH domain
VAGLTSPTVRRRRLGSELRRLREAAGLTLEHAAEALECSVSKVSRMETARVLIRTRDVRDLLDLYGLPDGTERDALLTLARDARQQGWWHSAHSGAVPSWFEVYVELEADASAIGSYEPQFVPGLLQTADYSRAVFAQGIGVSPEDVENSVALRLDRQRRLGAAGAPALWFVVDEAVLRRPVGGVGVMRGQLDRLLASADLPHVTLQVLPFSAGAYAGMGPAFAMLTFPDPADPTVVYVEQLFSGLYLEKAEEIERYTLALNHLQAAALGPEDSIALVATVAKEWV